MKSKIMYIECKSDKLTGPPRIGRVKFSQSGNTIYYKDICLAKTRGYKFNYFDVETEEVYWVSGCKQRGDDTLYPGIVEIDEDAREEYWLKIRNMPECVTQTSIRSEGKYSKRKPK